MLKMMCQSGLPYASVVPDLCQSVLPSMPVWSAVYATLISRLCQVYLDATLNVLEILLKAPSDTANQL